MPPKRRGTQPKAQPTLPAPDPPRPPKQAPPAPPPMPPPPPVEPDAARVRKEWSKFIDAWYEPHKKKLIDKLQKELLVKYKNLGSPKDTQKLREMELFEKLDAIAQQLAQPARTEWERRLELAHLREDQWDDMSAEEQQAVMGVFVGFFDDVEDIDQDDDIPVSLEDDAITDRPSPFPPSRQAIPPTPTRGNFEFVNPTSFFVDTMTPPNPTRNLPALPMDHLATLGPSNSARTADPLSGGVGATLGFQNWASEVGIVSQQPSTKLAPPPQTLSRPRATDIMSRQPSAASNFSSPLSKTTSPQYSPPIPTTKFSPPINAESLPLGKRYIGPVITEEEPDPLDQELLKSKMADDYQQYKISLRIQMIYQFHAEAADIEIKLFESLLSDQGTKESRARAVQEHETSMMRLREQKEEDRKRLCAEEREKRRQEMRQHLAQRRPQVEPKPPTPPVPVQPRSGKVALQKENVPLVSPPKLEPPSIMKKSASTLSQDDAAANEALFAAFQQRPVKAALQKDNVPLALPAKLEPPSIMKKSSSTLSQDDAAANEALFAAVRQRPALQKENVPLVQPAKLEPPSIMKKSSSTLSQDDATANEALFAAVRQRPALQKENVPLAPPPKLEPPSAIKKSNSTLSQDELAANEALFANAMAMIQGKGTAEASLNESVFASAATAQESGSMNGRAHEDVPAITVSLAKDPAPAAQPPPRGKKGKKGPPAVAKAGASAGSAWGASPSKPADADVPKAKKPPASKKSKKVTVTEEPDVDAPPPPKSAQGAGKAAPIEEPVVWGQKPQLKVSIAEEEPVRAEPEPEEASLATAGDGAETEPGVSDWFSPENMSYWANVMADGAEPEPAGKHVRWTPTVGESDDEGDEGLETNLWMQYAISGGDIPVLEEPQAAPQEKKTATGDFFDRAALTGQWPKMEWMSRGQSSGSARVF